MIRIGGLFLVLPLLLISDENDRNAEDVQDNESDTAATTTSRTNVESKKQFTHAPEEQKNHSSSTTLSATTSSENSVRGNKAAAAASTGERNSSSTRATAPSSSNLFQDLNLKVSLLKGHHHDVCAMDVYEKFVVSGGYVCSMVYFSMVQDLSSDVYNPFNLFRCI